MSSRPKSITTSAASSLLEELRIRHPSEIDVELIAAHRGLSVIYKPLVNEEGHLVRSGEIGIIVVANRARESAKWRFVIAHELGHFERHPTLNQFEVCTDADLRDWYGRSGHETEANQFAAELLMPQYLFERLCDRNRPSLDDIRELATQFDTSLSATAIRFINFCPEPCALVISTNGVVERVTPTKSFPFYIPVGMELNRETYAGDIHAGKSVEDRPQLVDGAGWADGRSIDLQEHSIKLGRYNTVMTLLWHKWQ